jgi:hypothetical protein
MKFWGARDHRAVRHPYVVALLAAMQQALGIIGLKDTYWLRSSAVRDEAPEARRRDRPI